MNLQNSQQFLEEQVSSAVAEWWQLATSGRTALYLHFRPSSAGEPGAPERMRLNADRAQTFVWIMQRARRLPILPIC